MNGKLPANNFTCPQSYLRPNILYYQGGPQIQQQNQAMPGIPYYFIPSQSFTPYLTGFGCTATINTAPAATATAPQKGLPKGAVNTHVVPPPKASEPIPIPAGKRPFSITKYDWHASTLTELLPCLMEKSIITILALWKKMMMMMSQKLQLLVTLKVKLKK